MVCEGSKQSVHSFSSTSLRFIRSHTVCIELASSHGGLCLSSQASNESTVSCKRYGTATRTLRFLHLPVSAGGPIVAVSTLFVKAAKCRFALNIGRLMNKCLPRGSQLKTAGTQKVFPLSPLRTPLTPSQKNKVCNLTLGGTGGTLFAQHCSCPAVSRCYIYS